MKIEENFSLKDYNTFGIACKASQFISVKDSAQLVAILKNHAQNNLLILGGGSNMLLTQDVQALVLHIALKGISIVAETNDHVIIEAMAGENWHDLVTYCISNNFGGIENLSLIPGNVGTAPVQNIGAYGVELQDVFHACKAIHIKTQQEHIFTKEACKFGYRDSIFKQEAKGAFIITSVQLKLTKKNHLLKTSYGAIAQKLEENNIKIPTIKNISDAVIQIRQSKLPDPKILGNSGSFFKNPIISKAQFSTFIENHPDAPFYKISDAEYKIPAGWLIEKCGFKGARFGDAGVHKNQALVLVNYGNATGKQIWELAEKIRDSVYDTFQIKIMPEVNII